eukprot:15474906-Alexandrium_andersonii.AAC.1
MTHRRARRVERLRGGPRSPHTERPERLANEAPLSQPVASPRSCLSRGARRGRLASTHRRRAALRR